MMRVFARSREKEKAWKISAVCLGSSLVLAPFVMLIFKPKYYWSFAEVCVWPLPASSKSSILRFIVCMDLLHRPRIGRCPPSTTPPPTNFSPNGYRFLLPRHPWLLPRLLPPQLARPRDTTSRLRPYIYHFRPLTDSTIRGLCVGVLDSAARQVAWRISGRLG